METKEIEKKIDDLLTRGVGQFVDPGDAFRKKLLAKAKGEYSKDIIIKFGVDPTRPNRRIVFIRKNRKRQEGKRQEN